jgi:hypothetical protein
VIWLLRISLSAVLLVAFDSPAETQVVISAKDFPDAIRALDNAPAKNSLGCNIQIPKKPYLDFVFRYITMFSIGCDFGIVQPGMNLIGFVRVTPERGQPVLMTEDFDLSRKIFKDHRPLASDLDQLRLLTSGGFATGPGRYSVEVVLTDQRGHTCRRQREMKTGKDKHGSYEPPALPPDAVAPLSEARWDGKLSIDGLRLTVLLHAEGAGLGAEGRVYLLESLAELLTQIPCQSVKLIAFNLDRQQEIFRQDHFDSDGFVRLEKSMEQKEFVTIPYESITRDAGQKFLLDLAQNEGSSVEQPDAVVFLGRGERNYLRDKLPMEAVRRLEVSNTQFFYLRYFRSYPGYNGLHDPSERLTKGVHGAVFDVRSPETLKQAIRKMLAQINSKRKQRFPATPARLLEQKGY